MVIVVFLMNPNVMDGVIARMDPMNPVVATARVSHVKTEHVFPKNLSVMNMLTAKIMKMNMTSVGSNHHVMALNAMVGVVFLMNSNVTDGMIAVTDLMKLLDVIVKASSAKTAYVFLRSLNAIVFLTALMKMMNMKTVNIHRVKTLSATIDSAYQNIRYATEFLIASSEKMSEIVNVRKDILPVLVELAVSRNIGYVTALSNASTKVMK